MGKSSKLFVDVQGEGDIPVVLLHGFAAHHGVWHWHVNELARERLTLAYDLPGHADSLTFPGAGTPSVAAKAVVEDIDRRGFEKVHVVGHSMGGVVACLMAMERPELLASMTLLAPGGFGSEVNEELLKLFAAAGDENGVRDALASLMAPDVEPQTDVVTSAVGMRSIPGQVAFLQRLASDIVKDGKQNTLKLETLADLEAPIRLVWGEDDPLLPVLHIIDVPDNFDRHVLGGRGHMLIDEAPYDVLRIIRRNIVVATENAARKADKR